MITKSMNPLSAAIGGNGLPSTSGLTLNSTLGMPTKPKVATKVTSKKGITHTTKLPVVNRNPQQMMINSLSDTPATMFTDDDFLVINFLDEKGTYSNGLFTEKVSTRLACWEMEYVIRTVPSIYFDGGELEESVVANLDHDYDEYVLRYVHQSYCDHNELKILIRDILMSFIDPKTHLIAAEVKITPRNLKDFLKQHGGFKNPISPNDSVEIEYTYDLNIPLNWSFIERPLTSSPVSLEYWRTVNVGSN